MELQLSVVENLDTRLLMIEQQQRNIIQALQRLLPGSSRNVDTAHLTPTPKSAVRDADLDEVAMEVDSVPEGVRRLKRTADDAEDFRTPKRPRWSIAQLMTPETGKRKR